MDKFYFVVRDCHYTEVSKRHETETEALAEAERLCKKERKPFIVLEAKINVSLETPVVFEKYI